MTTRTLRRGRRLPRGRVFLPAFIILATLLSGCHAAFTPDQIRALRSSGFGEAGDDWMIGMQDRTLFPFDSRDLDSAQAARLIRIGQTLSAVGIGSAEVRGYTDTIGSAAYNERLSRQRAQTVSEALARGGMHASLLRAIGCGARDPVADNASAEGRRQNRRVAIVVSPVDASPSP